MKELPIYTISIEDKYKDGEEDLGINQIAFVKEPAIKIKGMAYTAVDKSSFQIYADKLKYRITAPIMVPSTIYRNDGNGEEYYVKFTSNEIEKIYSKLMRNYSKNKKTLFNLEHSNETVPAYMLECWVVENPEQDKSLLKYGIDVPAGSVMMTAQITDKDYYDKLVQNNQFAFSIEGFLGMALSDQLNNITKQTKEEKMNDNLMLPDGIWKIGDKEYQIKDGLVVDVKDIQEEVAEQPIVEEPVVAEMAEDVPLPADAPAEVEDEVVEDKKDFYTKEEVDAKFDELYQMISEMKAESIKKEDEVMPEPAQMSAVKMSANEFLMSASNKLNKLRY